jgi:hypothetical protein
MVVPAMFEEAKTRQERRARWAGGVVLMFFLFVIRGLFGLLQVAIWAVASLLKWTVRAVAGR